VQEILAALKPVDLCLHDFSMAGMINATPKNFARFGNSLVAAPLKMSRSSLSKNVGRRQARALASDGEIIRVGINGEPACVSI